MSKVVVCRGVAGAGKSTWAKQFVADNPDWIRVNKDDIRASIMKGVWDKNKEKNIVVPERDRVIASALRQGLNVIVDDTNLEMFHIDRIREIAAPFSAEVEIKYFYVDTEEAIRRDAKRGAASVGEKVIRSMAAKIRVIPQLNTPAYEEDPDLPWCVIVDLDGTISLNGHGRSYYDATTCDQDLLNTPVHFVLEAVHFRTDHPTEVIFLSGREDTYKEPTERFLAKHWDHPYRLFMRKGGDMRKDAVIKSELFDAEIRGIYNVRFVMDDRSVCIQLWRSLGLAAFQVADGEF